MCPKNLSELFANGDAFYDIQDDDGGDNVYGMGLFLDLLDVPDWMIEVNDGTQVVLNDGKIRLCIDCGGLGSFFHHSYEVTVLRPCIRMPFDDLTWY